MYFPESYNPQRAVDGALVAFTGAKGEEVKLHRDKLRNLRQLSTTDGKEMRFEYDALNRISKATDSRGRSAVYQYDLAARLVKAKTPNADRRYTYAGMHLESVRENGRSLFQMRYLWGRVSELILPSGQSYKLRYDPDPRKNHPVQIYLTSPDGKTEKFTIPSKK